MRAGGGRTHARAQEVHTRMHAHTHSRAHPQELHARLCTGGACLCAGGLHALVRRSMRTHANANAHAHAHASMRTHMQDAHAHTHRTCAHKDGFGGKFLAGMVTGPCDMIRNHSKPRTSPRGFVRPFLSQCGWCFSPPA